MLSRICSLLRIQEPDPNEDGLREASGTSVPTDGTAGYAKGCTFINKNGGVGSTLYVNEGTVTSCDFNAK